MSGDKVKLLPKTRGFMEISTGVRGDRNVTVFEGRIDAMGAYIPVSLKVNVWQPNFKGEIAADYFLGTESMPVSCVEYAFPNREVLPETCL
ncbi:MAG: hypothetical protein EOO38_04720 [Cytophagaceae bacterium]|nr:MAG: hypothetical protein EOO38_04720 [Cytophagaceae bacterium]